MTRSPFLVLAAVFALVQCASAFSQPALVARTARNAPVSHLSARKKNDLDLSDIETRDLTRAEMEDINKQNEEIMNMELQMMTVFSLVLSLPILYLCWVAFYSD
eukprot:CAMPEP_0197247912 /NCGR_PEP_ID=MMETSP1429-20130617/32561_1 /TAXON_ID=49237 /ORGANISM="Chaetoceros  sp., Strain UNC1202" /LENGTH=103 /DNA_ID=CAMNT_0042708961 /DNA_START=75 /DNA_END=386 /DNA_ORIENTATION=+